MLVSSYGTKQSYTADFASHVVWNRTLLYFLNVSPVNANFAFLRPSIYISFFGEVAIVTPTNFVFELIFPLIVHPQSKCNIG